MQQDTTPDYVTVAQDGGKVVSLTHRQLLPPGNTPKVLTMNRDTVRNTQSSIPKTN